MRISRYELEKVALSSLKGRLKLEKNNNKSVRELARYVRVNNVEEFRKGSQPYSLSFRCISLDSVQGSSRAVGNPSKNSIQSKTLLDNRAIRLVISVSVNWVTWTG